MREDSRNTPSGRVLLVPTVLTMSETSDGAALAGSVPIAESLRKSVGVGVRLHLGKRGSAEGGIVVKGEHGVHGFSYAHKPAGPEPGEPWGWGGGQAWP